jgi:hypothetical protein
MLCFLVVQITFATCEFSFLKKQSKGTYILIGILISVFTDRVLKTVSRSENCLLDRLVFCWRCVKRSCTACVCPCVAFLRPFTITYTERLRNVYGGKNGEYVADIQLMAISRVARSYDFPISFTFFSVCKTG